MSTPYGGSIFIGSQFFYLWDHSLLLKKYGTVCTFDYEVSRRYCCKFCDIKFLLGYCRCEYCGFTPYFSVTVNGGQDHIVRGRSQKGSCVSQILRVLRDGCQ